MNAIFEEIVLFSFRCSLNQYLIVIYWESKKIYNIFRNIVRNFHPIYSIFQERKFKNHIFIESISKKKNFSNSKYFNCPTLNSYELRHFSFAYNLPNTKWITKHTKTHKYEISSCMNFNQIKIPIKTSNSRLFLLHFFLSGEPKILIFRHVEFAAKKITDERFSFSVPTLLRLR